MRVYSSIDSSNALAFHNGRVYTINNDQPWAEAFIVSPTGVIEHIGSNTAILEIASARGLIQYDLRQRFVMPGIHDAHTHLLVAGLQGLNEARIGFDSTPDNLTSRLAKGSCACAYANVTGDWLIGNFYQASHFPNGVPDRKYLDEQYPDQPVLIREVSCHRILLNTAGLIRAGIDPNGYPDPDGGYYVRRKDGITLTGEVVENAMTAVFDCLPIPPLAHVKRAIHHAMSICHKFGITSCQEASGNTLYLHAVRELELENRLDLDIHTHIVSAPVYFAMEPKDSLAGLIDVAEGFRSRHVHTQFVKFWLDGAPLPPEFTQADLDANGQPIPTHLALDKDFLYQAVKKYDSRGMTCKLHVAGEGSARLALDVIAKVRDGNPAGPRHELAHCNAVHKDDIARFALLKVTAEMSPAIFHHDVVEEYPELNKWAFNGVLASGALMTIGSDWMLPETPSLFDALAAIVERVRYKPGGRCRRLALGETAMQRGGEILCRVLTLSGAEAVGAQHRTGSLEVGKMANFIVVDRDLSQGNFKGANVLETWFEGRKVYQA
ncbi:amidohydrolase [Aspergillus vadensis CBS 113365]|uniref:Amidohydrolase-like protein 3 n=1 Tax=Aspergillus vadensis (strain CBS 113365 / IMI 142717 / IBT 24658) TaxID=1448311 RepID=A0A319AXJ3_ASPVC|nr:amidohydrolase-like protein 3 [Aspergillus vadensis CBS 113365]PYH64979.1 amidohydrolase-like protein 3 [Aspergillus vadensis CBS 113365]